jgi:hypothetical protein
VAVAAKLHKISLDCHAASLLAMTAQKDHSAVASISFSTLRNNFKHSMVAAISSAL